MMNRPERVDRMVGKNCSKFVKNKTAKFYGWKGGRRVKRAYSIETNMFIYSSNLLVSSLT